MGSTPAASGVREEPEVCHGAQRLAKRTQTVSLRAATQREQRGHLSQRGRSSKTSQATVNTLLVAKGVFTGAGRIVEVDNRPADPENVNRDNLVFPQGTMHIRSTNKRPTMSLNPQTCVITFRVAQTNRIEGGRRRFRHATGPFAGTVRARAVAARKADGTCNQQADALLEADVVSTRGMLSY